MVNDSIEITHGCVQHTWCLSGCRLVESQYEPGFQQTAHSHNVSTISVLLAGGVRESAGSLELDCLAGDVMLKPSGRRHSNQFGTVGARLFTLAQGPDAECASGDRAFAGIGYGANRRPALRRAMLTLWRAMRCDDRGADLDGLLCDAIALSSDDGVSTSGQDDPHRAPDWLLDIKRRLSGANNQWPQVRELARTAGRHPVYLARAFRRYFGVSVIEYAQHLRLARAVDALTGGRLRLVDVALEQGFSDQAHFSRTFKSRTGLSPGMYRRLLDNKDSSPVDSH